MQTEACETWQNKTVLNSSLGDSDRRAEIRKEGAEIYARRVLRHIGNGQGNKNDGKAKRIKRREGTYGTIEGIRRSSHSVMRQHSCTYWHGVFRHHQDHFSEGHCLRNACIEHKIENTKNTIGVK